MWAGQARRACRGRCRRSGRRRAGGGAVPGPAAAFVERLLESQPHPEQGYRSCLGLMALLRGYGAEQHELSLPSRHANIPEQKGALTLMLRQPTHSSAQSK